MLGGRCVSSYEGNEDTVVCSGFGEQVKWLSMRGLGVWLDVDERMTRSRMFCFGGRVDVAQTQSDYLVFVGRIFCCYDTVSVFYTFVASFACR